MPRIMQYFREVDESEAPALFSSLRGLSEKAGVEMPSVHFQKPGTSHPVLDYLCAIIPRKKSMLVLGDKARELFGVTSPGSSVSEEFSAVLAHELGHAKHHDRATLAMANASPFVGMAVAIGATAYFAHYQKKKREQKEHKGDDKNPQRDRKDSDMLLPGEEGYSHRKEKKEGRSLLGKLTIAAKYMAASAIGLTAGLFVYRALHHHMEYSADKFSAELLKDGKPLARALKKYANEFKKLEREAEGEMRARGIPESTINTMQKISKFVNEMTHPSFENRVERLNRL